MSFGPFSNSQSQHPVIPHILLRPFDRAMNHRRRVVVGVGAFAAMQPHPFLHPLPPLPCIVLHLSHPQSNQQSRAYLHKWVTWMGHFTQPHANNCVNLFSTWEISKHILAHFAAEHKNIKEKGREHAFCIAIWSDRRSALATDFSEGEFFDCCKMKKSWKIFLWN